jgi:hypothetical protein
MTPLQPTLSRGLSLFWCINALVFFLHVQAPGAPTLSTPTALLCGVASLCLALGSFQNYRWSLAAQLMWLFAEPIFLASQNLYYLVHPLGLCSKNLPIILLLLARDRLSIIRFAVALVWFTEGLFPKMLFQQQMELAMSSWFFQGWIEPSLSLYLIGAAQLISAPLALFSTWRWAQLVLLAQLTGLVLLPLLVLIYDPSYALFLFAPLFKNLPIFAATYWLASKPTNQGEA